MIQHACPALPVTDVVTRNHAVTQHNALVLSEMNASQYRTVCLITVLRQAQAAGHKHKRLDS